MKFEFNDDGSIKLPDSIAKRREENERIFREEPSIKVTKNQISTKTPPMCELLIEGSPKLIEPQKIASSFNKARGKFRHMSQLSLTKMNRLTYKVKIISGNYRCSWCENFRNYLEEELKVPVINKGSCSSYSKTERK